MNKQKIPDSPRKPDTSDPASDERLYQLALQSATDGLWDWRIQEDLIYYSPQWFTMLGYSPDELSAGHETFRSLVHPDDLAKVDAGIAQAFAGGPGHERYQAEFRMHAKDGAWHWILSRGRVERDAAGKPSRFTGTHTDITELKQTTERLHEEEELFTRVFQMSPDPLIISRMKDGVYLAVNQSFTTVTGYSAEDVLGRSVNEIRLLANPEDRVRAIALLNDPAKAEFDADIRTKDGSLRRGHMSTRLIDFRGETCLFTITRDITEQVKSEEALRESENRYRQLFEAESDTILLIDNQTGRLLEANSAAEQMYGFSREELLTMRNSDLSAEPEQTQQVTSTTPIQPQTVVRIPLRYHKRRDGSVFPVEITGRFFIWQGKPVHIAAIRDITERRQAETELLSSQERLQQIVDNAPYGAHTYDLLPDGALVFSGYNQAAERILGVSHQQFMGKTIEEAFPALVETPVPQGYRQAASSGERFELDLVNYQDEQISGAFEVSAFRSGTNRVTAFFRDVTERKRAETALRHSEALLRTLVEANPETVVLVDVKGAVLMINEAGARRVNHTVNEVIGRNIYELVPPDLAETRHACLEQVLKTRQMLRSEEERDEHFFTTVYNPVLDDRGEVVSVAVLSQEVTEQRLAAQSVQRMNEVLEKRVYQRTAQLEAAVKELESFSYSVSHDLRAPLRAINGFGQALQEDYGDILNEEALGFLSRIRQASTRMGELIDNLLKLSRVTRSEIRMTTVDLSSMAAEICGGLLAATPDRRVTIQIQPGLIDEGDPLLLRIALDSLLSNAFKFTSKHPTARVSFGRIQQAGESVYCVGDDGAGFDMAYVNKLFGTFQRLHGMTEFDGSGIGLATVQRIINRHGGRVWAEGAVEQGATFYFTLGHKPQPGGE